MTICRFDVLATISGLHFSIAYAQQPHDMHVVPPANAAAGPAAQGGLRLEQLEQIALANNPTVAQVQANLRVAAGLARQAGLHPNPTVGYYGDEVRGGYTGGGK